MLTVDIEKIVPTSDSLRFGLTVRYGENGPVRFCQARLDDDVLDWKTLTAVAAWINRQVERHLDREQDLEDDEMLPLDFPTSGVS